MPISREKAGKKILLTRRILVVGLHVVYMNNIAVSEITEISTAQLETSMVCEKASVIRLELQDISDYFASKNAARERDMWERRRGERKFVGTKNRWPVFIAPRIFF